MSGGYKNPKLSKLQFEKKLSASDFTNVWCHYDSDMNGYIEERELDEFLMDLFTAQGHFICRQEIEALRNTLLECYDTNRDGKIEVAEMTKILPVEDNFLLHFRLKKDPMTMSDFLRIWQYYDADKSGFLERKEVKQFIMDMISTTEQQLSEVELEIIVEDVFKHFDQNKDGLIELAEMKQIFQLEDNYLTGIDLQKNLSKREFNKIFKHYDTDGNGYLEGDELMAIVGDLMARIDIKVNLEQLNVCVKGVMEIIDHDHDGRVSKSELASLLKDTAGKKPDQPSGSSGKKKSKKKSEQEKPKENS